MIPRFFTSATTAKTTARCHLPFFTFVTTFPILHQQFCFATSVSGGASRNAFVNFSEKMQAENDEIRSITNTTKRLRELSSRWQKMTAQEKQDFASPHARKVLVKSTEQKKLRRDRKRLEASRNQSGDSRIGLTEFQEESVLEKFMIKKKKKKSEEEEEKTRPPSSPIENVSELRTRVESAENFQKDHPSL